MTDNRLYHSGPPFIRQRQIVIDMDWWKKWRQTNKVAQDDLDYINSIVESQSICPHMVSITDTERSRKILNLTTETAVSHSPQQ